MNFFLLPTIIVLIYNNSIAAINGIDVGEQCNIGQRETCKRNSDVSKSEKYLKETNRIYGKIQKALKNYKPCANDTEDVNCVCHAAVIANDLEPYKNGISRRMIADSAKYGTQYKILNHRIYRTANCMFPSRCAGIEYFLLGLVSKLPDMDLVVNTRDWPQLHSNFAAKGVVFSFSKTTLYQDIMYPAWTFWAGGPAISLHPTGIGRWDLLRESISKAATLMPWMQKQTLGFFRGSRTSDERDALVLLSRRKPHLIDAKYTKNQAWKSPKDTLYADPAKEVSFEDHCQYKYLFNFRGVAASFRFKHLFLCKSLVFHVGDEWNEFFYFALKPWVHYVPLKSYPSEEEIEEILMFFREHDDLAQDIAERGHKFIWEHLRIKDVNCYWRTLLRQYQRLLGYKVVEDDELIEIKAKK